MIESITIKNVASFDETGIQINELRKINFIYGANGSGKTVISNLLSDSDSKFISASVNWQHNQPLNSLVYNKRFRESNFGTGTIKGVFTLGQATKEDIELIEIKQAKLKELKEEGLQKKETLDKQIKDKKAQEDLFKETSWKDVYKKHEQNFKEAFTGVQRKEAFKCKLLIEFNNNTSAELTFEELKKKAETIFGEIPKAIPLLNTIYFDRLIEIGNKEIWTKKIIGKSDVNIAKLIQKLNLDDWLNQGRGYLQEGKTCPFCQQPTITDDFKKELEDYFDESFTESIKKIKSYNDEYNLLASNLINELTQIETNEKANKATKLNSDTFSAYLKTLSSQFISNKELLNNKIKEPSRSIELISVKEQLEDIEQLIIDANKEIEKHNVIVANYNSEKTQLIQSIWKVIIEENRKNIEDFNRKTTGLQIGIGSLEKQLKDKRKEYTELDNEIKELTKNVTSIQPTVDEINKILKKFGFLNFEIVPSKSESNHYQILRENGELAESSLSEGEITFITFLYFLQLAKGATQKEAISEERILVVDDPISSLDSNVLFVVSTLLKGIIKEIKGDIGNIKQIIFLTHNVYFHNEVSFIDGRTKEDKHTFYWILRKKNKASSIQSFKMKNPIQTSYKLLWQELKYKERNSIVTIQNTMRRIIENYFKFLGGYKDDYLIQQFANKEEQEICRSLIFWINAGSHSINDDLFIESQDDTIDKYLKIFKDIFMLTKHEGHYNMMMGIE